MSDDNKQINDSASYEITPADEPAAAPEAKKPVKNPKNGKPQEIVSQTPKTAATVDFDAPDKKDPKAGFDENRRKEYKDHKFLQILLGIIAGAGIWCALWFLQSMGGIFGWVWVILFGVVFIGKSRIEKKKNVYFRMFTLAMLIGLVVAMAATICIKGFTEGFDTLFAKKVVATATDAAK